MAVQAPLQHARASRVELHPDAVTWDGVVRHFGGARILAGYLRDDPRREQALLDVLPPEASGIVAHGAILDGCLWLDRVSVPGPDDVLLDMVLWHALFPGLKAPQVVFWMSGDRLLTTDPPGSRVYYDRDRAAQLEEADMPFRTLQLSRGVVTQCPAQMTGDTGKSVFDGDMLEWPLWLRLLLLPLVLLFVPFAMLLLCLHPRQQELYLPWWMAFLMPVLLVALVVNWCAPVTFDRYLEHHVQRFMDGTRDRKAVRDLLKESLNNDRPRAKERG
jgi:hypothetical protein